jgi:hypothetical protein
MNLAIKPEVADSALQFAGTSILLMDDLFDHNLYRFSVVRNAQGFRYDGN